MSYGELDKGIIDFHRLVWSAMIQYGARGATAREIARDLQDGRAPSIGEIRQTAQACREIHKRGMAQIEKPGSKKMAGIWIAEPRQSWCSPDSFSESSEPETMDDEEHAIWLAGVLAQVEAKKKRIEAASRW